MQFKKLLKQQTKVAFLLILLNFYTIFSNAQIPKESERSIEFKTLKFQTHSGDSILYDFGMLKVPENRLANNPSIIEVAVLRLKARAKISGFPIVFLAGGPGQSGIDYIKEEYFQNLIFPLQEDHDIILLDQRGSGRSLPSLEFKLPEADNRELFLSKERIIILTKEAAIAGAADFKMRGIDIAGYNTIQNADDLNDLRLALGSEKMTLLAYSYGTHLALATARKYSSFVDNMVLIGPSGLNHMHHLPSTYDKQLKRISDMAAQDSLINNEVPDMVGLLKSITEKLEKQPIYITIKDFRSKRMVTIPIGKFGLQMILRFDIGDSNDFIYFPALLYGIEYGDYRLLQLYAQRRYNQYNGAFGSGIYAMRQASGATQKRYEQIAKEGKTALLGNAMNTPDIYAGWDNIDLGDSFRASFKSNIRTLFISGTLDSNTPSSNVEELEKGFYNSNHVIIQNAGHEDMLPARQVQELIIAFIRKENISLTPITLPKPRFVAVF